MRGVIFFCSLFLHGIVCCSLQQYKQLDEERVEIESRLHAYKKGLSPEVVRDLDAYESVMKRLLLLWKKRNRLLNKKNQRLEGLGAPLDQVIIVSDPSDFE